MTVDGSPGAGPGTEGFVRVHVLSPFIRGGLVTLAVLGYLVSQQIDRVVAALSSMPDGSEGETSVPLAQVALVALTILGVVLLGFLSWWFTGYRLGGQSLEMRTGAIFRQHRQVRYDRIQAVDLVRPLLARLTGLAEVRVESAGGGDSHVTIAYLRHREAEDVRRRLLGLAGAADRPAPETAVPGPVVPGTAVPGTAVPGAAGPGYSLPEPSERPVLSVPAARIIASVLLSWDAILLTLLLVAAMVLAALDLTAVIGGFLPIVVLNAARALMSLTRWYGLTLAMRGDTLTSQRGLTDTRTSSVPLDRVQAVALEQPLLWRRIGWWSLKVNIAGARIGSASGSDSESVLVPVATTDEVLQLLEVVTCDPETTAEVASLVDGTPDAFVGQPRRARWLHPLARRRIGYLPGRRAVVTRSGRVQHRLQVVPWGRIQSLTLEQGVTARRLGLASVHFVSTVGPVRPTVKHLDAEDAEVLGHLAAVHSSHARRRPSGPVGCDPAPDTVDWAR
ncbi:PH domain-containing protein [Janibacter sp. GS2]|uniref:PH domain-containing protein n=1 Tax=Janibacter sp. GS2 TaxID=3442646 RepID=UPI003EBA663F